MKHFYGYRRSTADAPEGCDALFDWGIERFGTPERLFAYARTLPPTPGEAARAWVRGELRVPTPEAA